MLRPGAFDITDKAMEVCGFEKGAKILEIGCGEGETLEHLEKDYGYDMTGIDMSLDMVQKANERGLKADIKFGDGEFLDGFMSYTFDGVIMECVLSLIHKPDEALHEAYCVLKKGGRLFISDLYHKDPDPDIMAAVAERAARDAVRPHEYQDCENEEEDVRMLEFFYDGRFFLDPLIKCMKQIGYKIIMKEDRSDDLVSYVAEKAMDGEQLTTKMRNPKKTGYFMLVAEKPE
ncbi:MAG: class I SAM-dependent methyltransferase [Anaerovoracaceae bacterium]|jgi:ubiquinone/menaquinone biosynthesis C-methylase UbiE